MTCAQLIEVLPTLPLAPVKVYHLHEKPAGQPQPMLPKSKLQAFGPKSSWLRCQVFKSKVCQLIPQPIHLPIYTSSKHLHIPCPYFCSCHSYFWACPFPNFSYSNAQTSCHTSKKASDHQAKLCGSTTALIQLVCGLSMVSPLKWGLLEEEVIIFES